MYLYAELWKVLEDVELDNIEHIYFAVPSGKRVDFIKVDGQSAVPFYFENKVKCDRINSLASVLLYTAHREIQELLCEIMDLCKEESEDKQ